jgi:hypothetical protein
MWHPQVPEADVRMGKWLDDIIVLARCSRFAAGFPDVIIFARCALGNLASAYADVVSPAVDRQVADKAHRAEVDAALRSMSMKMGMAMLSYARLVGREQRFDVAALAGAVTRLYDDLIDGSADGSVDDRIGDLFGGRPFTPATDLERLLGSLLDEIRSRAEDTAAAVVAVNSLHEYQSLSRRQREAGVSRAALQKICNGKGAMANLTLCSLVHPYLAADERELVMAFGEAFQALDDYMDVHVDARNGVATLARLGDTTLASIGRRLRTLRPLLVTRYGGRAARRYCGMIYFALLKAAVERRLPVLAQLFRALIRHSALRVFVTKGADALPAVPASAAGAGEVAKGEGRDWCAD